jgi:hypothetical protein
LVKIKLLIENQILFKNIKSSPNRLVWISVGCCWLVSQVIVYITRTCGFILTPDSAHYLSAAASFRNDGVFLCPDGSAFTNWPPLYPMVLSIWESPLEVAPYLYTLFSFGIAFFIGFLATHFLKDRFVIAAYSMLVLLGTHFLLIHVFFWSELLFMLLLLGHTYIALTKSQSRYYFLMLSILGFFLCLQRNAGMYWVGGTMLWLLLYQPNRWIMQRVVKVGCLGLASVSGLLFWHGYNYWFISKESFENRPFFSSLSENISLISTSLGKWLLPVNGMVAVFLGVTLAAFLIWYWRTYFRGHTALTLLICCILLYTLGFLPIPRLDFHDMERYFAVVTPVVGIFVMMVVEHGMRQYPRYVFVIRSLVLIFAIYVVARMLTNSTLWYAMACN